MEGAGQGRNVLLVPLQLPERAGEQRLQRQERVRARLGETVEANTLFQCRGDNLHGVLAVPVGQAGDQAGLRADHLLCSRRPFEVAGFIDEPVGFPQRPGVGDIRVVDVVGTQPDQALRISLLGRTAKGCPATLHGPATILRHFGRGQLLFSGEGLAHQLGIKFLLTFEPVSAIAGAARGQAQPVHHEAVNAGLADRVADG